MRAAFALAAALVLGLGGGASAQNEDVPTIDLTPMLEGSDPSTVMDAPNEIQVAIPQLERVVVDPAALRALPVMILSMQAEGAGRILRITGETGEAHLFLDLPDVSVAEALFLSYRTSVDTLPDRSELRITVNGTETDPVTPVSTDAFQRLELPAALLVAGRNEITVAVTQAHRIYCGSQASFQIWSEFDLNASGVALKPSRFALSEEWLRIALIAQAGSGNGVPLRGGQGLSPAARMDLALALSGVAGGWLRPESGYGPDAATPDLMRITVVSGGAPGFSLRRGAGGAIVLALVPTLDGALPPGLDAYLPKSAAMADLPAVPPGQTVTLAELGFLDTSSANHYSRKDLRFRLPEDWLILASQRAYLTLNYAFVANLPEGAILLVKMNGRTLQLLPLDKNGGEARPPLAIEFPARLLHPGANELTFEATVPGDPPDLPCGAPLGPFLTISGDTDLTVPVSPRMQVVGMGPALLALPRSGILLPPAHASPEDVLAQLALMAEMQPIDGQSPDPGASLTVVSLSSADQVPLSGLGLNPRELTKVLDVVSNAEPVTEVAVVPPSGWAASLGDIGDGLKAMARPGDPELAEWLKGRTGDAVLVMPDEAFPARLWLIVGPSPDPANVARAVADARTDPAGPRGQVAILDADGKWQDWHSADAAPMLQEPLSLMNFRFVAGAYASWDPLYFVLLMFGLTAVSVVLGIIFVVTTRGGRKQ